ncbi:hypothetical protein [Caloranaerobacter sp. DY30410]|uniref:hypothetical protein n=1 Tax=Caloranaerobacter sp. DY30410 TaxID=3238305 RepID=UPI003D07E1B5
MMSKIDEVFKKILNDTDIFDSPRGEEDLKLFKEDDWKKLKELLDEDRRDEFKEKVDNMLDKKIKKVQQKKIWSREDRIKELKQRAEWLKSAFDNKPYLLRQLIEILDWYGLVECKLPNMETYGKIIEKYEISIVEEYLSDKIRRTNYSQRKALEKVFEYIKELYHAGVSSERIAYFVRKLNSLTKYWEVIE